MPYDAALAARLRALLEGEPGFSEKKMFGGVGFMLHGHMAAGVMADGRILIRCAPSDTPRFSAEPGCSAMERGGKPMAGWLLVDPDRDLSAWAARGVAYARSLPPK